MNALTKPFDLAESARERSAVPGVESPLSEAPPQFSDEELLDLWQDIKKESLNSRWMFERQWQRKLWYILGRQWIEYMSNAGGWRDKRIAQWIPRPVTNKCKETLQSIRSMFSSIQLGVNVRPNGQKPENVSAAATADALAPVLHEAHDMDAILNEFDFWLIATGNAFIHTFVDYDVKHGVVSINQEQCQECGTIVGSDQLTGAQPICPACQGTAFAPAVDEQGLPVPPVTKVQGRPTTLVLSPLELAFPNTYPRFSELPYVVRLRWRTKRWFESHPVLSESMDLATIAWQKSPTDQSLRIFTNLSKYTDLGLSPTYNAASGPGGSEHDEGLVEYETWMKPCAKYPDGLVFRIYGDTANPIVARLEESEGIPGVLPYTQFDGTPLWTFAHAGYEHVGGRVLASGPLDVIIQKQDQLNQLDSMILLIIQRMSNPVWLEPKGAEIQKLTGMPGLVIKYTDNSLSGRNKPERIAGVPVDSALFNIREQYLRDIEELTGTFDIIKGAKPAGVEAASALQILVERSQARFASVFAARGNVYKDWFTFAIELEREFGPDTRTKEILEPGRGWTYQSFKRLQLNGSFSVIVEGGTATPKTALGMRAAVDHAAQLQMLNLQDPDTSYAALRLFGLTTLIPSLDIQIQGALQKQQAFQDWVVDPQNQQVIGQALQLYQATLLDEQATLAQAQQAGTLGTSPLPPPPPSPLQQTPLKWQTWFDPIIHRQECMKWANSDRVRDLLKQPGVGPLVETLLTLHLAEINQLLTPPPVVVDGPPADNIQGAGRASRNSNQNSGGGGNGKIAP